MKVYEFVKIHEQMLKVMSANGVEPDMADALEAYETWRRMDDEGEKREYIYAELNRRFGMSRTTIYRLVKKFSGDISM